MNRFMTLKSAVVMTSTLAAGGAGLAVSPGRENIDLRRLNVDPAQISVSGLSSGAFVAMQAHVAYSKTFMGAGLVAGGPYGCAEGSLTQAVGRCMSQGDLPDTEKFIALTQAMADQGDIDRLEFLRDDRVWIFHGKSDRRVWAASSQRAAEMYQTLSGSQNVSVNIDLIDAGHAMPTQNFGADCAQSDSPYLGACEYDAAGLLLNHIYGPLAPAAPAIPENLLTFDQSLLSYSQYLDETGYIYVPDACREAQAACRVHIALHGCKQNRSTLQDTFARHAGYNAWAESNRIIVVYPQTSNDFMNRDGCWDWWGYADTGHGTLDYLTQKGPQMQFIKRIVDRLTGTTTPTSGSVVSACYREDNLSHSLAGRAHYFWWQYYAVGSMDYLGFSASHRTSLRCDKTDYCRSINTCI
ncbi:probable poly(3-hydroxybutyrate) depolymerase precursor [Hahella chejuensis KCTC 2396]|uniref:Probable poly(3-hydroxybutyrate) depolymerase n=1 Tax=Hahella chejuensis (strain KCTC 2396) TaxID=349521 RepID=Q2SKJ0_HAHCH|nr:PHB depolymerase family esterase [Hahella chejuensis]ABC28834.1 probable poly(3-hydroxybutyrate) depolymerase precursor [Hahella chejuensis KCTC 2396]